MIFRLRYKKLGGHIHCRLFESPTSVGTFEKNGDIVFDEQSWPAFQERMTRAGIEVVPEEIDVETVCTCLSISRDPLCWFHGDSNAPMELK